MKDPLSEQFLSQLTQLPLPQLLAVMLRTLIEHLFTLVSDYGRDSIQERWGRVKIAYDACRTSFHLKLKITTKVDM